MLGCAIEAIGEGFALVRKYNVVPDVFYDVMTEGLFACGAYKIYGKIITEEKYLPAGQRAVLGLKDANLALAAGEAVGVPLPSGNVWRDRLVGAVAHGEGEHDWAVMARTGAGQRAHVISSSLREAKRSGGGGPCEAWWRGRGSRRKELNLTADAPSTALRAVPFPASRGGITSS